MASRLQFAGKNEFLSEERWNQVILFNKLKINALDVMRDAM